MGLSACGDTDTFLTYRCRKLPLSLALRKNVMVMWANLLVTVLEENYIKKKKSQSSEKNRIAMEPGKCVSA